MIKKIKLYINQMLIGYIYKVIKPFLLFQYLILGEEKRAYISPKATINNALLNTVSGEIHIEDYVFFGHNVCVLTGTHDYHKFNKDRMQIVPQEGRDIWIEQGAWIASNSTIIGPCVLGEHCVVAACSLVTKDVPAYTVVAGIPAKVIKTINHNNELSDK